MTGLIEWAARWYRFARTDRLGRPHKTPAPGRPRVPAPNPVPGGTGPVKSAAGTPSRQPPAPGTAGHFTHGRRLLTVRFYEDGATCIWDATGTHVATFQSDHDWDKWLRRMTPDGI